jgi:nicotinamidase-related amidase
LGDHQRANVVVAEQALNTTDRLLPAPLTERTVHLCLDMQRLFSADGPWPTPWMERVLPVVTIPGQRHPERTVFTRFTALAEPNVVRHLQERDADGLIVSGAETDVCVLSTVLDAVDLGYRVIIVKDALCSSSDEGHDMLLRLYGTRYSEQIETGGAETILARGQ